MKSSAVVVIFSLSMELTFWHKKKWKFGTVSQRKVLICGYIFIFCCFSMLQQQQYSRSSRNFFESGKNNLKNVFLPFFKYIFQLPPSYLSRSQKSFDLSLNSLIPFKITSYDVEVEYFEILLSLMEHFLQQNSGKYWISFAGNFVASLLGWYIFYSVGLSEKIKPP